MNAKNLAIGVVLAVLAAWALAWRTTSARRGEVVALRAKAAEVAGLRRERDRLIAEQVSPEEMQKLREERAAVQRMRQEIGRMRESADGRARSAASHAAEAAVREVSLTAEFVAAKDWKNAGRASAVAALETALWAAAGGDVKALAETIVLEPGARGKVDRLLDRLPREVSTQFKTAEDFLALMTANDVPLSEAHVLQPKLEPPPPEGWALLVAEFRDEKGQTRTLPLRLFRASPTEWRLVVPEAAIEKYGALLAGGSAQAGSAEAASR